MIEYILALFVNGRSYVPEIAVETAFVLAAEPVAPAPVVTGKCCTECKNTGRLVHGDGHSTDCKCPPTCACKKKAGR